MNLSVGIVGLPNVGKSTLFNALTQKSVPAENYPFCTIDPSVGVVEVPDSRLHTLSKISGSEKTIPAIVEFVDIAGLVKGASAGEGLGNQFLSNIKEVSIIAHVVRIFEDSELHHVEGTVDPKADAEVINLELILSDIQTLQKRLDNLQKDIKKGNKDALQLHSLCERLLQHLQSEKLANSLDLSPDEIESIKHLNLLTMKPMLFVCNKKHDSLNLDDTADSRWDDLLTYIDSINADFITVDAGVESELSDLNEDEKVEFRREYGSLDSGIDALIRSTYKTLGMISYFTTGEKETRAWTIPIGSTAPEAGAAIHTDFRDKYIRALVVGYADFVTAGSKAKAREQGLLRTEGKEYIVSDGDVVEFLHS